MLFQISNLRLNVVGVIVPEVFEFFFELKETSLRSRFYCKSQDIFNIYLNVEPYNFSSEIAHTYKGSPYR